MPPSSELDLETVEANNDACCCGRCASTCVCVCVRERERERERARERERVREREREFVCARVHACEEGERVSEGAQEGVSKESNLNS